MEQLTRFLECDYESASRSLREGMAEMFTLQRLKLPPSLYKCLATTNLIESPQSGVAAWLFTENRFRKISGHRDLWALATILGRKTETEVSEEKVA